MKNLIEWIKSNPIVTACVAVSVLGIVVMGYFYVVSAPSYSAEKSETLKEQKQRQDMLMRISVPLPNQDPNAPADMYPVVINQKVINEVGGIYQTIQQHYVDILATAKEKNNRQHVGVLLGGGAIWPDANPTQNFDLYVRAAADYKDHFKAVFNIQQNGLPANNPWNIPVMSAGSPPTPEELEQILAKSAFEYISSVGAQTASDLSQSQAESLFAEQRLMLMNALKFRAGQINLYAELPREEDRFAPADDEAEGSTPPGGQQPGFGVGAPGGGSGAPGTEASQYPFRIAPWAYSDQPPTPDQLWEGQVQLWIMRDLMIAISETNKVGKLVQSVGPDGAIQEVRANVTNSPIKRLLQLDTLTGYVGLHNTGAALGGAETTTDFAAGPAPGAFGASPTPGLGGPAAAEVPSIYPTPPTALAPKDSSDRAVEHFGISPTGRISNSVFDVRHSQLVIDIEAAHLPAFMEKLRTTNFMAVVKAQITDLDEYELLKEGYVYGHNDVVRATLVIESLWFRNWTEELMPKIVKEKLLIIKPAETQTAESQFN